MDPLTDSFSASTNARPHSSALMGVKCNKNVSELHRSSATVLQTLTFVVHVWQRNSGDLLSYLRWEELCRYRQ